ncbi:MAG TPA: carotenoid oxygenase family protein [Thermoleophilaceae bacterium]|nr:carotenoid oxygenase family protein [Thermoleophilaceae bacterium]
MAPEQITRRSLLRRGAGAAALTAGAGVMETPALAATSRGWRLGFESLHDEVRIGRLPVDGHMPKWLAGTLVRNGPAQYEVGDRTFNHWFDGLGMLHAFTLSRGRVGYANRFLRSSAYEAATEEGIIRYSEFATDPCRAIFNGAQATFSLAKIPNANVHVGRLARHFVATTEVGLPVKFDPRTLRTLGVVGADPPLGQIETVHPHRLGGGRRVFYDIPLIPPARYQVKVARGTRAPRRLAAIPRKKPAYMHSFGLTERYVVLTESPFVVDPLKIITDWEPFIRNYRWEPSRGANFWVVDRRTGRVTRLETDPLFTFHHVNAFERDGKVHLDMCGYDDADVIDALYLDRLRGRRRPARLAELRRYELDLRRKRVRMRPLAEHSIELPRINYGQVNGRPYRYAYGISIRDHRTSGYVDQLVKIDVRKGEAQVWREKGCYPGEAVFVPRPNPRREDDGVALSVVLDARRRRSFLLVLDARSFTEVARAEVPHHIPYGFHGELFRT